MSKRKPADQAVYELLIPGLLGPVPVPADQRIETPMLDLLLARGEQSAANATDLATALLERFGAEGSAPYCLAADAEDWDRTGFWLHADPVHLRADRDLLRLFDARHLAIGDDEAQALVADLNAHFIADGLHFSAPSPVRWYLRCERPPKLRGQPLELALGRHVDGLLPSGPDAARWAGMMNEAQMLLFQSAVSQRREAAGRPAVNGLWTWGGGVWRRPSAARLPRRVYAEHPLAAGLAMAAELPCEPLPETPAPLPRGQSLDALALYDRLWELVLDRDEAAWITAVERLDHWLAPLLDALRTGRIDRLVLDTCAGQQWSVTGADLRRFWRRPRPLATRLVAPG